MCYKIIRIEFLRRFYDKFFGKLEALRSLRFVHVTFWLFFFFLFTFHKILGRWRSRQETKGQILCYNFCDLKNLTIFKMPKKKKKILKKYIKKKHTKENSLINFQCFSRNSCPIKWRKKNYNALKFKRFHVVNR